MQHEPKEGRGLERLRKEAKRWLKALRDHDADAHERFVRALGASAGEPTLRAVQHALARERGFAGWPALAQSLGENAPATIEDRLVERFLDNACPDHHVRSPASHVRAKATAMRLLARHPELCAHDFVTAVVCGDVARVERMLADDPSLATRRHGVSSAQRSAAAGDDWLFDMGPKGWEPLLFLCFTRLDRPDTNDNAVAIARLLLAHGADPNAYFMAGGSQYTPLVGVIGEGEEGRPSHPRREELVQLLLDAGAHPFDMQVFYNIHFNGRVLWYLRMIHAHTTANGGADAWRDPEWRMIGMGGFGDGARFLLGVAIDKRNTELAEWLLAHGASPTASQGQPANKPPRAEHSLYELAVRAGATDIAELLVRYGAPREELALSGSEKLVAACLSDDRVAARALAEDHPEYLRGPLPMFAAVRSHRIQAVQLLLDLGMSPDVADDKNTRALHIAAHENASDIARLLIERGAEVDAVERNWGGTPLGNAAYSRNAEVIAVLREYSRDVWELTPLGDVERMRTLLRENSERATVQSEGHSLLMWLPSDHESRAIELAELLLANGADPRLRNKDGYTAAERAERIGMADLATLLRLSEERLTPPSPDEQEENARALLDAYRTGTPEAMERHWNRTWHRRAWRAMRSYVQADLGKRPSGDEDDVEITMDDARYLVAKDRRQMSDDVLRDASSIHGLTMLNAGGSQAVTDAGVLHLATLGGLKHLDLRGTSITDAALTVLDALPALESISLAGTRVTDAGVAHLSRLRALTHVNLAGTRTGDGALRALAGMEHLRHLRTGALVTDDGLALLGELPVFRTWRGGEAWMGLTSYECEPNQLALRGSFTDRGMRYLRSLDGLFGLNLDDSALAITPAGLEHLVALPHLGWLATDATDESMPVIARMPHLRFLGAQDTVAGDAGFSALSGSRTIEYIWGRRCHNLQRRGFAALSAMPALRALSVSCLNVDDAGVAALPDFPALRELMPMDVPDEGYRHIGQCRQLESLVLMYCRDTSDRATELIAPLATLRRYFASYTRVTDRTPALLSAMDSLERITFSACHGITDAGVAVLARLPRLRELRVSGRGITPEVGAGFPSRIAVYHD
ncbi:MAG TPA: ankyrin repeat domain-containing protein [Gemmatimonadaceae bacterium]|jgi:ankyrin repeat protein